VPEFDGKCVRATDRRGGPSDRPIQFHGRELESAQRRLIEATESREALEAGLRRVDRLATLGSLRRAGPRDWFALQILNGAPRSGEPCGSPPEIRRVAQVFEEQSDRIAKIVEQLLSVARRKPAQWGEMDAGATVPMSTA